MHETAGGIVPSVALTMCKELIVCESRKSSLKHTGKSGGRGGCWEVLYKRRINKGIKEKKTHQNACTCWVSMGVKD